MDTPTKCCTKCGVEKPLTVEYFQTQQKGRYWAMPCRECRNADKRRRFRENPEKNREQCRNWRRNNPEKLASIKKRSNERCADRIREYRRRKYAENRELDNGRNHQWRNANLERKRAYDREYQRTHREQRREYLREYRAKNREHLREVSYRWRHANPHKVKASTERNRHKHILRIRLYVQNRRARELALPDTLTQDDWNRAMQWWDGCCAYCGNAQGLFNNMKITADHYIPVTAEGCPGNVPTNIIPACLSCNSSKKDKQPEQWALKTFGEKRAKKILATIRQFFAWVSDQDQHDTP